MVIRARACIADGQGYGSIFPSFTDTSTGIVLSGDQECYSCSSKACQEH